MGNPEQIIFIAVILISPWLLMLSYIVIINRNIKKNYKSLANKYSFEVDASKKSGFINYPLSHGQYRGIPVEICSFRNEEGKKKTPATYVSADCTNENSFEFIIVKKNSTNNIKYGAKAFTVNDSELDGKFIINTNDTEKMFGLLNFSVKYKLQQSMNVGFKGKLFLTGTKLRYEENELIKGSLNLLRIEILLHLVCEIADELKGHKEFKN